MAYSKVNICNIGLAMIGADNIYDLEEDNKRASLCNRFFDPTKDYLLTKFDWPFARRYKKLQMLDLPDDEVPPGLFPFALPADCKTPRSLRDLQNNKIQQVTSRNSWEIMGNVLYSELQNPALYYTGQEVNVGYYSDTFSMLLALGLAVHIAPPITKDMKLTSGLYEQYKTEQRECWESDANIGNTYREPDNDPDNDTFVYPSIIT